MSRQSIAQLQKLIKGKFYSLTQLELSLSSEPGTGDPDSSAESPFMDGKVLHYVNYKIRLFPLAPISSLTHQSIEASECLFTIPHHVYPSHRPRCPQLVNAGYSHAGSDPTGWQQSADWNSGVSNPSSSLHHALSTCTDIYRALLVNIRAYNEAHANGSWAKMETLRTALRAAIPLLQKVGMFDLFPPEEWIQGNNEGRKLVGRIYQEIFDSA